MVTAFPISCAGFVFPGTPQLPGALRVCVCAGIDYCVIFTYLSVPITSLEIDLHTAKGREQQTSAR